MTVNHRPGDPRREPPLRDAWDCDPQPGAGLARAILITLAALVLLAAVWSACK